MKNEGTWNNKVSKSDNLVVVSQNVRKNCSGLWMNAVSKTDSDRIQLALSWTTGLTDHLMGRLENEERVLEMAEAEEVGRVVKETRTDDELMVVVEKARMAWAAKGEL